MVRSEQILTPEPVEFANRLIERNKRKSFEGFWPKQLEGWCFHQLKWKDGGN